MATDILFPKTGPKKGLGFGEKLQGLTYGQNNPTSIQMTNEIYRITLFVILCQQEWQDHMQQRSLA